MDEQVFPEEEVLSGIAETLRSQRTLLLLTLVVAACSIAYELLIAHSLALLAANAVTWYSIVIGFFLCGMGIGAFLCDSRFSFDSEEIGGTSRRLFAVELGLSCIGFVAVPLLHSAHSLYSYLEYWGYSDAGLVLFFGISLGTSFLIGTLSGVELPLLISLGKASSRTGSPANAVLAFDYFGSLLGAVCFSLLLVPTFSTFVIGGIIAALNLCSALFILFWLMRGRIHRFGVAVLCVLLIAMSFSFLESSKIEQFFLKRYYCYRLMSRSVSHFFSLGDEYPDILRVRSPYQQIDLIHDMEGDGTDPFIRGFSSKFARNPNWPHNRLLFLNGDWQFHSNHEEVYHEWFAHVPISKRGKVPKRVLVLGGGDGMLIREILRYPQIRQITHVDLDNELIDLAKSNALLLRLNNHALLDERVDTRIADGFQFVKNTDEQFEIIYIDFPTPTDYNLSKLYSREFYNFVRRRLTRDGVMVFDSVSTGALLPPDESGKQQLKSYNHWEIYLHTLRSAGFTRVIPYTSSLGFDNSEALRLAQEHYSPEEARNQVLRYALVRQQGFIMAGLPGTSLHGSYRPPPGPPLYVLNKERFLLSFQTEYPKPEEIDPQMVNSIFHPRLLILPIWNARLPF
ncbi:hypothetical protein MRY87_04885 [bacterium]|nr:hypothetical protein [bacterium]